jgi:IS605 OrfB family transposase
MLLVLKNKLKGLNQKEHYFLKSMCHKSKDVYNATLYAMRQHFFKCGERLTYNTAYHTIKKHHAYQAMPAQPAQQSMMMVDRAYASFFGLLRSKRLGHYVGEVKLPRYLDKDGYFPFIVPNILGLWKTGVKIRITPTLKSKYKLKEFKYPIPECIQQYKIKQIRIIPKLDANYFEIEYVYEVEEPKASEGKNCLSIDIGVNNFATCLDEKSGRSFIMDGRELKSLNRLYNKTKGELQSTLKKQRMKSSHRIRLLGARRGRQINEYMNQYSNFILQYCLNNDVGFVVIGEGWMAQNGVNHGDKNNQNFVNIPFAKFVQKLKSKLMLNGISFKVREESYTSKCDHLAGEEMCHHEEYMGKRRPRGLFKSSTGITLNADVNGALGIMLKEGKGNTLRSKLNSGGVNPPRRIRIGEIRQTSSKRLAKTLV